MLADPQKLLVDHAPRLHRRRSSSPLRFFGSCWAHSYASCLDRRVRSRGSRLVYSSRSHLPRFGGIVLGAQQKVTSTVFNSREKLRAFVLPPGRRNCHLAWSVSALPRTIVAGPSTLSQATGTRDVVALPRFFYFLPFTSWLWNGQSPMFERRVGSQDAIRCGFVWSVFPASPILLLRRSFQVVDVRRRDGSLNGCLQCIFGADVWHTCSPIFQSHNRVSDQLLLQFLSRPCALLFEVRWGSHARAALGGAFFLIHLGLHMHCSILMFRGQKNAIRCCHSVMGKAMMSSTVPKPFADVLKPSSGFSQQASRVLAHAGALSCGQLVQTWSCRWCLRVACNGLCTAARFHTVQENSGCILASPEGHHCLRHYFCCPTFVSPFSLSHWPGTGECKTPTTSFSIFLFFKIAVRGGLASRL